MGNAPHGGVFGFPSTRPCESLSSFHPSPSYGRGHISWKRDEGGGGAGVSLRAALERLNPRLPAEAISIAVDVLTRDRSAMSLAAANREIYELLKEGVGSSVADMNTGPLPKREGAAIRHLSPGLCPVEAERGEGRRPSGCGW